MTERFEQKRQRFVQKLREQTQVQKSMMAVQVSALEIPVFVVMGLLLGLWVDGQFDTDPWGKSVGLLVGVGGAVRTIRRLILQQRHDDPVVETEADAGAAAARAQDAVRR
jgi:F0F1-type ATP synthase assembly protein I